MTLYSKIFTAGPTHIDIMDHVNNAVWVQWIQDIATAHWESIASTEQLAAYAWMVTRHEIDYRGNIKLGESVTGRTWISEAPRGARFNRNVAFDNPQGQTIVQAVTSWALVDRETLRLLRVRSDIADKFYLPQTA